MIWAFASAALAAVGCWGIGRLLISRGAMTRTFVGLFAIAAVIGPVLFLDVRLARPLAVFALLLGQAVALVTASRYWRNRAVAASPIGAWRTRAADIGNVTLSRAREAPLAWAVGAAVPALALWALHRFFPPWFVYEQHDATYFGWIPEMWFADTPGPLRMSLAWPELMGVTHMVPGTAVAVLGAYLPSFDLTDAAFLRGLMVFVVVVGLAWRALHRWPNRALGLAVGGAVAAALFSTEVFYEMAVSGYVWAILLLLLTAGVYWCDLTPMDATVLCLLLLVAKAPLVVIVIPALVWLVVRHWRHLSLARGLPLLLIVGANVFTWLTLPPAITSRGDLSFLGVSFSTPREAIASNINAALLEMQAIPDWITDYVGYDLVRSWLPLQPAVTVAVIAWLILKIYVLYFALRWILLRRTQLGARISAGGLVGVIDILVVSSLIAWLFIRTGTYIGHMTHAYLLAAAVPAILVVTVLAHAVTRRLALALAAILAVAFLLKSGELPNDLYRTKPGLPSAVKAPVPPGGEGIWYQPRSGQDLAREQVIAAIQGKRMRLVPDGNYGNSFIFTTTDRPSE